MTVACLRHSGCCTERTGSAQARQAQEPCQCPIKFSFFWSASAEVTASFISIQITCTYTEVSSQLWPLLAVVHAVRRKTYKSQWCLEFWVCKNKIYTNFVGRVATVTKDILLPVCPLLCWMNCLRLFLLAFLAAVIVGCYSNIRYGGQHLVLF